VVNAVVENVSIYDHVSAIERERDANRLASRELSGARGAVIDPQVSV
jgi:hypothetical protein